MFYKIWKKWKEKNDAWFKSDSFSVFIILSFFFIFSIFIIYRLYTIQIINGESFRKKVLQNSERVVNSKVFDRGKIYFIDREKKIPVAIQKNGYILAIDNINNKFFNKNYNNFDHIYNEINKIINLDKKKFLYYANKKGSYREIKNKITNEDYLKLKKLNIKGLSFIKESWREYPLGEIGSKIIGFLDFKNNGISGLEKFYNKDLVRENFITKKNIFIDIFSKKTDDFLKKKEVVREADLFTSIDVNVQNFLQNKLINITKKYNSKDSLGIIIKPATGEILAMADSFPVNFNKQKKDYRNKMVEFRYEPGSIIKPLVVAIGLDSKSINKNFTYNDTGCMIVQGFKVCNYDKKARGSNVGLVEIIQKSLNLGMVNIQRRIKNNIFLKYFINFGLSEETGIDLPNEISQRISSLDYNIDINYATASFGQGVSFSPIATLRALSVIANDGFLVKPHIVNEINYGDLVPSNKISFDKKRVLSIETVEEIKDIMVSAVNKSNIKQKYQRKMYSVAAKTGTAQIADKKGGYKKRVNLHTFFGFFPVNAKPEDRYAIILYTFEPQAKYSSQTLTKPFYDIIDFLISYYDIKPDRIK